MAPIAGQGSDYMRRKGKNQNHFTP